jgi:hypothetical protein
MRMITLEFELDPEDAGRLLEDIEDFRDYWAGQQVRFTMFRHTSNGTRYTGVFFTERTVDEVVRLIQTEGKAKELFDRLKEADVHLVLSVLEELP